MAIINATFRGEKVQIQNEIKPIFQFLAGVFFPKNIFENTVSFKRLIF